MISKLVDDGKRFNYTEVMEYMISELNEKFQHCEINDQLKHMVGHSLRKMFKDLGLKDYYTYAEMSSIFKTSGQFDKFESRFLYRFLIPTAEFTDDGLVLKMGYEEINTDLGIPKLNSEYTYENLSFKSKRKPKA